MWPRTSSPVLTDTHHGAGARHRTGRCRRAARLRGRGDEKAADQAAVDAMRQELNRLCHQGHGGDRRGRAGRGADALHREAVGSGKVPPSTSRSTRSRGTTICAKNLPNALAVIAIAEKGSLLFAPDVYMDKIAIGPGYADGVIDIDASPAENIASLARAKASRCRHHRRHASSTGHAMPS